MPNQEPVGYGDRVVKQTCRLRFPGPRPDVKSWPDRVGLILGLEMSRLARSCRDWHHLLELCGRYRVLLADADGVYDPTDHSDRLLLGLQSSMS